MTPIRVLVVDDSVVIRKALSAALSRDPEIQVVATASDGQIALAKLAQLELDVVTLDVEMPVMNGLEALSHIRALYPTLPVIMFSTLTERGAEATLEALTLGASDYATKPSNTGSMEVAAAAIERELIPKIKALCRSARLPYAATRASPVPGVPPGLTKTRAASNSRIEIVAIGSSTGGPNALTEVMRGIPADFPVPIVIVQHMPPVFTRLLADRITSRSAIPVEEGRAGVSLESCHAWIAPGNFHMTVAGVNGHLKLNQDLPENSCRPAVDVLFRSVASTYRAGVLGVVMTGMGGDGTVGARSIREAGGTVIIQDEASSVVWGMPGSVYAHGLADGVYPLDQLASEIVRRVTETRKQAPSGLLGTSTGPAATEKERQHERG